MKEIKLFSDLDVVNNSNIEKKKKKTSLKSMSRVESDTILFGDLLISRISKNDYSLMISYLETVGPNTFKRLCDELDNKEISDIDCSSGLPDESDRADLSSDILFWFMERWPQEDVLRLRCIFDFCRRGRSRRLIKYILKN